MNQITSFIKNQFINIFSLYDYNNSIILQSNKINPLKQKHFFFQHITILIILQIIILFICFKKNNKNNKNTKTTKFFLLINTFIFIMYNIIPYLSLIIKNFKITYTIENLQFMLKNINFIYLICFTLFLIYLIQKNQLLKSKKKYKIIFILSISLLLVNMNLNNKNINRKVPNLMSERSWGEIEEKKENILFIDIYNYVNAYPKLAIIIFLSSFSTLTFIQNNQIKKQETEK